MQVMVKRLILILHLFSYWKKLLSVEVFASLPLPCIPCSAFKCLGTLWGEEYGGASGTSCAASLSPPPALSENASECLVAAICIISWVGFSIQSASIVALIAYSAIRMM